MAGIAQMNDLAARKRALSAESEIYRQTIRLEVRNVQLYVAYQRSRLRTFKQYAPILSAAALLARAYVAKKNRPGLLGRALWLWQIYQRAAPALRFFVSPRTRSNPVVTPNHPQPLRR